MTAFPGSAPACDFLKMKEGDTCVGQWKEIHAVLHPAQECAGYAAVKRKLVKNYDTKEKAQKTMNNSVLPFVLGPNGVPYLIDAHHTTSALHASGFHNVQVTLKKVCDWSDMDHRSFYSNMMDANFMMPLMAKVSQSSGANELPVRIPLDRVAEVIPSTISELKDDPWRSLGALVRKVKDTRECKALGLHDDKNCFRGYHRECNDDNSMTPFFEFRWAYFMNDAFVRGCDTGNSLWDDASDCKKFQEAYTRLNMNSEKEDKRDSKAWKEAARLLVPLCRGRKAGDYVLPTSLGKPMGGTKLPGYRQGVNTPMPAKDPKCAPPVCAVPSCDKAC
jgi:hypothetical protein